MSKHYPKLISAIGSSLKKHGFKVKGRSGGVRQFRIPNPPEGTKWLTFEYTNREKDGMGYPIPGGPAQYDEFRSLLSTAMQRGGGWRHEGSGNINGVEREEFIGPGKGVYAYVVLDPFRGAFKPMATFTGYVFLSEIAPSQLEGDAMAGKLKRLLGELRSEDSLEEATGADLHKMAKEFYAYHKRMGKGHLDGEYPGDQYGFDAFAVILQRKMEAANLTVPEMQYLAKLYGVKDPHWNSARVIARQIVQALKDGKKPKSNVREDFELGGEYLEERAPLPRPGQPFEADGQQFKVVRVYPTKGDAQGPLPRDLVRLIAPGGSAALLKLIRGSMDRGHYLVCFNPYGDLDGHPAWVKPLQVKRAMQYEATELEGEFLGEAKIPSNMQGLPLIDPVQIGRHAKAMVQKYAPSGSKYLGWRLAVNEEYKSTGSGRVTLVGFYAGKDGEAKWLTISGLTK